MTAIKKFNRRGVYLGCSLPVFIITLLAGCDLDKFTGYTYDSDPLPATAKIYGRISNQFTGDPLYRAQIRIENQAAFTDENGDYIFYYHWSEDDQRDKPLPVRIGADKFHVLDTAFVVYPQTRLNAGLIYGAPIIRHSALVNGICQVIVFDYQGAEDITTVEANFFYKRAGERQPSLKIEKSLFRVMIDSTYYGFYQTVVETEIEGFGTLINSYHMKAMDKDLFSDSTSNAAVGVDTLLFLPVFN
jgi:hypothetical protein